MASNSAKMTFEERIVQKIKDDTMGSFIGDEDSITELAKRAVHEALMKQRADTSGYATRYYDSPVMQAATAAAKEATEKVVKEMAEKLFADEAFKKAVNDYLAAALPTILGEALKSQVYSHQQSTVNEAVAKITNLIQMRQI